MKLSRILCPIDFSNCSISALKIALSIVNNSNIEIHLFHAILMHEEDSFLNDEDIPNLEQKYDILSERAREKLSVLLKDEQNNPAIKYVSRRGFSASEEILRYIDDESFDLIVMGTHSRSLMREILLGSVAEKIIRLSPIPVMTVRENSKIPEKKQSILVPIDFSDHSRHALEYALKWADMNSGRIIMLHVVKEDIHPEFYNKFGGSLFETDVKFKEHAIAEMKNLRDQFKFEHIETQFAVTIDEPARGIVDFVKQNDIHLIVIATHGLSGFEHFILGSTTERVLHMSPIPTLVIK